MTDGQDIQFDPNDERANDALPNNLPLWQARYFETVGTAGPSVTTFRGEKQMRLLGKLIGGDHVGVECILTAVIRGGKFWAMRLERINHDQVQ